MATTRRENTPPNESPSVPWTPSSLSGTTSNPATDNPNPPRQPAHKAQLNTAGISPRSEKGAPGPGVTAASLTGQAAMTDLKRRRAQRDTPGSRHTSPNPAVEAVAKLMGGGGMSKPTDAPAPEKLSEPLRKAAEKIHIPENNVTTEATQASPVSLASFSDAMESTLGANAATTATATGANLAPQYVAEPAQMEGEPYNNHLEVAADDGNKAFSYPGPPPAQAQETPSESGPSRGMSYPGLQGSPKSPASNKRHKCPYCATDFTRHHNLKSHLLTHSQEKPYVCQTCQARFRRLHDLKRHTKLHTGERPHTCDKCGRRFARGDALARHNKGPGGCAGRRSSFGGDDDFGDGAGGEGMDGVEYGDDAEEEGTDPQARRVSEPSRKRTHLEASQDANREVYRQHSSTYPPIGVQRPHGSSVSSMGPPAIVQPGSSTATSPREMSGQPSPAAGANSTSSSYYPPYPLPPSQAFGPGVMMTESPKPLSPGQPPDQHRLSVDQAMGGTHRNRSPSLTTQFQQQHFGRGSGGRTPPQPPAPFSQPPPGSVILPPPSSQPTRQPLAASLSSSGPGPSSLSHGQVPPGTGSNPSSLSSHGRSSGSSMRDVLAGGGSGSGQDQADIWAYVRSLEQRFSRMQDEYELRISRLSEEIISLRGQVAQVANYNNSEMPSRY